METDSYSANQRRAINLVWTACGDYQFEPQFLALKADGTPDFYMNCVIGLVRKWLGDEMPRRLFALWADDTRRSAFDDLAWLALENAVYEKELPVRPVLTELRRAHAAEFFASEYQLSRQEWMDKNQLVYSLQSARWRSVLGQKPPLLAPWEKGLSDTGRHSNGAVSYAAAGGGDVPNEESPCPASAVLYPHREQRPCHGI